MSTAANDSSPKSDEKPLFRPPDREVFDITRMGLPLSLKDNLICGLVILLATALQIRLSGTFMAEGLIAFLGFIGYVAMRYWLLQRRYPEVGELIVESGRLHIPACVNGGLTASFDLENTCVTIFIMAGRNRSYSSVVIRHGCQQVKINWLGLEIEKFEKALLARKVSVVQKVWTPAAYALGGLVLMLVFFALLILLGGL